MWRKKTRPSFKINNRIKIKYKITSKIFVNIYFVLVIFFQSLSRTFFSWGLKFFYFIPVKIRFLIRA